MGQRRHSRRKKLEKTIRMKKDRSERIVDGKLYGNLSNTKHAFVKRSRFESHKGIDNANLGILFYAIQALVKRHRNRIRSLALKPIHEKTQNHFSQSLPYMIDSRFFQDIDKERLAWDILVSIYVLKA